MKKQQRNKSDFCRKFECDKAQFYESLFVLEKRSSKITEERANQIEKEYLLEWAKKAQEEDIIPSHEEYVEWKSYWNSMNTEEKAKIRRFVKHTSLYNFREILGLEEKPKTKFIDKDYIDNLANKFGSKEAAIAYLAGIRHATFNMGDDEKEILQKVLNEPKGSLPREERLIGVINKILEED